MKALGFIEVVGKVAAIEAADICLKSANVKLIGYEITNAALVTVKVEGDIGSVKAAIDAAKVTIAVKGKLGATLVIPRPATGISSMVNLDNTKEEVSQPKIEENENISENEQQEQLSNKAKNSEEVLEVAEVNNNQELNDETNGGEEKLIKDKENISKDSVGIEEINQVVNISSFRDDKIRVVVEKEKVDNNSDDELVEEEQIQENNKNICNLCHDPECSRKRGQPRNLCIHYNNKIENLEGDIRYEVK